MNRRKALKVIAITGPALVLAAKTVKHTPRMFDYRTRPTTIRPSWLPASRSGGLRLFFNGREISPEEKCFYANEAAGEVWCYKRNKEGNLFQECSAGCDPAGDFHAYKTVGEKHDTWVATHPAWRGKVEIRIV